jgi:cytochrome c oxidase subunit 3
MANHAAAFAPQFDDAEQQRTAANLGIWLFLATEILFFGVLFAAYAITRVRFPDAFAAASRLTNLPLAGVNTAVLITSSLSMALAVHAARHGARRAQPHGRSRDRLFVHQGRRISLRLPRTPRAAPRFSV